LLTKEVKREAWLGSQSGGEKELEKIKKCKVNVRFVLSNVPQYLSSVTCHLRCTDGEVGVIVSSPFFELDFFDFFEFFIFDLEVPFDFFFFPLFS
jgi:hypothetical protein